MKYLSLKIFNSFFVYFLILLILSFFVRSLAFAYNYSELTISGNSQYIFPSTYQIDNLLPEVNCSSIKYAAIQQGLTDSTVTYYANLLNIYQGFGICQQISSNSVRVTDTSIVPPAGNNFFLIFSTVFNGSTGYGTDFFSTSQSNPTPISTPTPFPSPTPTPSSSPILTQVPTPTSTPTLTQNINLPVPELKQYDLPWSIQEYDSASLWSPQNIMIARWGCALTSAAMVLQYYGIEKLPGGSDLNQGTLNTWLKKQTDGYVGDGLLNWIAIQRLSKQAVPVNHITSFDALMYNRRDFEDITALTTNLQTGIPGILEEEESDGGVHFVVAKGISGNTFLINDPYFHWQSLAAGYNNHFANVGWYFPSHTDLSYILVISDPQVTLSLRDSSGNILAHSVIQHPLSDEIEGGTAKAHSASMLYYQTPSSGIYELVVTSTDGKQHPIKSYLYDNNGNVQVIANISDHLLQTSYSLIFDKFDNSKDFETKDYSQFFANILRDLFNNYWLGLVDNGSFNSLYAALRDAQAQYLSGKVSIAKTKIQDALTLLQAKQGKGISESAYEVLKSDAMIILTAL